MKTTCDAIASGDRENSHSFNYQILDPEVRKAAIGGAKEIRGLLKLTRDRVVEIGQKLTFLKEKLGRQFRGWLKHEFEWSDRTASRFMQAATFTAANPQLAEFILDVSALYLLSEKSCPAGAVEEAVSRATSGEEITHASAKEIVAKYKLPKPAKVSTTEPAIVPEELQPLIQEAASRSGTDVVDWVKAALLEALRSLGLVGDAPPALASVGESEEVEAIAPQEAIEPEPVLPEPVPEEISPERIREQLAIACKGANFHVGRCQTYPEYYLAGFTGWTFDSAMNLSGQTIVFKSGKHGKNDLTGKIGTVLAQNGTELKIDLGINNVWTKERAIVTVSLAQVRPYLFEIGSTVIVKRITDERAWIGKVIAIPDYHHQFLVATDQATGEKITVFGYDDPSQIRLAISAFFQGENSGVKMQEPGEEN